MHRLILLYSRLPLALHYALAWPIYLLGYYLLGYRKKHVRKSLLEAFPEKTAAERLQLEKRSFRLLSENVVESLKSLTVDADFIKRHVKLENPELLQPYFDKQQSLLFLTLHQTNVEWMVMGVSAQLPCPMAGIYKPLHNKTMDKLVLASRLRFGTLIPTRKTSREILRQRKLYRGLMLVADQSPISREGRYWRLFLHRLAPFHYGPQTIAEATQHPVVFVHPRRVGRGQYTMRFEILAEPPHHIGGNEILERYVDACERSIREQPETWWWINKKWKKPKPGELEKFNLERAVE